jgi:exosortase A-associated hydrolase 2
MHGGSNLQPAMPRVRPRFLDAPSGPIFCVEYPPAADARPRAGVLIVAPIGEEMNKCRRMMALAAAALQSAGLAALYVDCHGTGDSAGDHREGTVERWRGDLRRGAAELTQRGVERLHVLAVRSGALLIDPELVPDDRRGRLALWQPMSTGKQVVAQWLRLATAGDVVAGKERGGEQRVRELLATQGYCEIAGYDVSAELIAQLEPLELRDVLRLPWRNVGWFEMVGDEGAQLSPAAARVIAALDSRAGVVQPRTVVGEPFWATPEIATSAALVTVTCEFLVQP